VAAWGYGARGTSRGPAARQIWQEGETVNVGFVRGLEVVKRIPTPGDYAPDAYVIWQPQTNRFYRFVPHRGIERRDNLQRAMES
jgi:hypothetical protein